ncbi:YncE family protein [Paenibacillus sp. FSL H3-0469]|uniref:YncE family protein n=1 Tax=Paenibacillus sp. FSL H3-0469 TaxID=2954506 RepID=UPI0031018D3E
MNPRNLPSGDPYIYVSYELNSQFGYVAVIDPIEDKVIKRIPVGRKPGPMGMDPGEKKLYVVNTDAPSVTIIDTDTFNILNTAPIGNPFTLNYPNTVLAAPKGNKVYAAESGPSVTIIDALTNQSIKELGLSQWFEDNPFAFAGHEKSNYIYVACVSDKDKMFAISIDDDSVYPYGVGIELTFDRTHNPLTVHPDGTTQLTLGPIGMATYIGDDKIGLSKTSSVLDNTVSGIYLDNKLLFCTMQEDKSIMKRITNLAIDRKGNITWDHIADVPSYKGQDKIRVSRNQKYIGVTIQPTGSQAGGLQIYNVDNASSWLVSLDYVGDLAFYSDTKAYVGEPKAIRPIDLATAKALPAIPIGFPNDTRITVKNIISGYSTQSS